MLKKIIGTTGTRLLTAFFTFLVIVVNAKTFGAEGVGTIGLFILDVTLINLFASLLGGTAVVYLVPRYGWKKILVISLLWSAFLSLAGTWVLAQWDLIPAGFVMELVILSFLLSIISVAQSILLGRQQIRANNLNNLVQFSSLLAALGLLVFVFHRSDVHAYTDALYISFSLTALFALIQLFTNAGKTFAASSTKVVLKELLHYGTLVQLAAIIQLLNYRLSYYIVDHYAGLAILGIYTIGVQVSEGIWIISRSMSLVLYSHISNLSNDEQARTSTIKFFKLSLTASVLVLGILMLIPTEVYTFVFGKEFSSARKVLLIMGAGILAVSQTSIISHYFSGMGKHYRNTIGSSIGLVVTLTAGFILIPLYGLTGAALTAVCTYMASFTHHLIVFSVSSNTRVWELVPTRTDLSTFLSEMKKVFG